MTIKTPVPPKKPLVAPYIVPGTQKPKKDILEQDFLTDEQIAELEKANAEFLGTLSCQEEFEAFKQSHTIVDPEVTAMEVAESLKRIKKVRVSVKSAERLQQLGFDPLEEQVKLYRKLEKEAAHMERLRIKPRVAPNGDTQRFSAMAHANILMLQQKIGNDLLRYAYARVSENEQDTDPRVPTLTIELTERFDPNNVIDVTEVCNED